MTEDTTQDVREVLEGLEEHDFDQHITDYQATIEAFMQRVVEDGTFTPDASINATFNTTIGDLLNGEQQEDVTGLFITGLLLGAALERDIPAGSEVEVQWRDGKLTLPECDET